MTKYTIFDISKYFLQNKKQLSHKKLQQLCFFSYCWFLYLYNDKIDEIENRLFENDFEAWVDGPISTSLYLYFNNSKNLFKITEKDIHDTREITEKDIKLLLNQILDEYDKYSEEELESIVHQHKAWVITRGSKGKWDSCDTIISDLDIFKSTKE